MTRLRFEVTGCQPAAQTAAPAVIFRVRITNDTPEPIHAMVLRCQVQIEPRAHDYTPDEQARLYELFGEPSQWKRNLHSVLWAQTAVAVPAFRESIDVDVAMPCTYDLEVAAAKYLHAIRDGEIGLVFLFTGTVFQARDGAFSVEPVPWSSEAAWRMTAATWHDAMDRLFPGGAWIRVDRDTLDALRAYKGRRALVSWDAVANDLLARASEEEPV